MKESERCRQDARVVGDECSLHPFPGTTKVELDRLNVGVVIEHYAK
jgi:hypothetical protein